MERRLADDNAAKLAANEICAMRPTVPILFAFFTAWGALLAHSGVTLAETLQFNGHYGYVFARLTSCRDPAAACRRRPRLQSGMQGAAPNDVAIGALGPGSVRLQGGAQSLRLQAHDGTIAAALAAIGRAFNVQYRSSIPLDDAITGTYAGSLTQVLARILDRYDYAIKHEGPALEVVVFGRSNGLAVPVSNPAKPAAVAPPRPRRCGRSAGHRAACPPT
jgi:hypothetical protein